MRQGEKMRTHEHYINAIVRELFEEYIKTSKEILITVASNSNGTSPNSKITKSRKQKWKEKQLYGYYKRQTEEIAHGKK